MRVCCCNNSDQGNLGCCWDGVCGCCSCPDRGWRRLSSDSVPDGCPKVGWPTLAAVVNGLCPLPSLRFWIPEAVGTPRKVSVAWPREFRQLAAVTGNRPRKVSAWMTRRGEKQRETTNGTGDDKSNWEGDGQEDNKKINTHSRQKRYTNIAPRMAHPPNQTSVESQVTRTPQSKMLFDLNKEPLPHKREKRPKHPTAWILRM